jgi:predicted nucleotidyltransferase
MTLSSNRGYIADRDFIRTKEGFFWVVVGYTHPIDRVIAYLKYIPSDFGKWKNEMTSFERVLPYYSATTVGNTFKFLRQKHPEYLFFDPVNQIEMSSVPLNKIETYFVPEEKLQSLLEDNSLDSLQKKAVNLIKLLSQRSDIPLASFGIIGSILLNIHNPTFSDIDVTVYGAENARKVKDTLLELTKSGMTSFSKMSKEFLKKWCESRSHVLPLDAKELEQIFFRRWNIGTFNQTRYSIHPIRTKSEILERYGDSRYTPLGFVKIKARIIDNSEAIFLPCKYRLADLEIIEGPNDDSIDIEELVSYEGLYCDLVEKDEKIIAFGKLEKIEHKGHEAFRVLIGSIDANSKDYMIPFI